MSMTKNTTTSGQNTRQSKIGFMPSSPSNNDASNDDETPVDTLIARTTNLRLLKPGEDCFLALPVQLVRLAAEASDGTVATRRANWDKVALIGKILQEISWKDRTEEFRKSTVAGVASILKSDNAATREMVKALEGETKELAKKLTETTTELKNTVEEMGRTLAQKKNNAAGLEEGEILHGTSPFTYAQAARAKAGAPVVYGRRPEAAIAASAISDRRFFVKSDSESLWSLTEAELAKKANLTIEKLLEDQGEDKGMVKVIAVVKLRGKGAFCVLRSAEEMQWMETGDTLKMFSKDWGLNAVAQPSHHEVIVEFVPTIANIDSQWTWDTITEASKLPRNSIVAARWIRKPEQRKPGQKVAHAVFAFADMRHANTAIRQEMVIDHKLVSVRREEKDPQRCMRCQQYGHIAREWPENFYCAVCKTKGHIAADRACPTLLRRIRERQQRDPTKGFRYFVTEDESTWDKANSIDPVQEMEWRSEVQKSYEQGWKTVHRGRARSRNPTGGKSKETPPGQLRRPSSRGRSTGPPRHSQTSRPPQRQSTLDRYISRSRSRPPPPSSQPHTQPSAQDRRRNGGWSGRWDEDEVPLAGGQGSQGGSQ
ncbi:hypothetical protein C8R42DRAFT_719265 [Lentinula raphanica]|nr:hypothetical protein C8R42DRAFT_719265 [Lentinula raphanica]